LAKKYLTESLKIARKINLSLFIGLNLMSLGVTAKEQGNYTSAHKYLKAALSHAQKNNNRDTESDILNEFGKLYIATGKLDKATEALEQARSIAAETGSKDFEAEALFQLSKIENMHGNRKKAIQLARTSLKLFVSIKYEEKAAEVRKYLKDELGVG
jgi:tetratricopeptide (TPR) repeat protein